MAKAAKTPTALPALDSCAVCARGWAGEDAGSHVAAADSLYCRRFPPAQDPMTRHAYFPRVKAHWLCGEFVREAAAPSKPDAPLL